MISVSSSVTWIILIFVGCCYQTVDGHSYGSGSCMGGPAVGGFHLVTLGGLRTPTLKSLATDFPNITVTIGNVTIDTSGSNNGKNIFKADTVYEYKITSTSRNMRGIMMRVEVPTNTSAIVKNGMIANDRNTHISRVCSRVYRDKNVQGITHWNSFRKNIYTGLIKFAEPTNNVVFDITMVTINSLFRSEYAYGSFIAKFVQPNL